MLLAGRVVVDKPVWPKRAIRGLCGMWAVVFVVVVVVVVEKPVWPKGAVGCGLARSVGHHHEGD